MYTHILVYLARVCACDCDGFPVYHVEMGVGGERSSGCACDVFASKGIADLCVLVCVCVKVCVIKRVCVWSVRCVYVCSMDVRVF